jgi:hypothetical protein
VRDGGKLTEEEIIRDLPWSPAGVTYLPDGPDGGLFLSIESPSTIRHLSLRDFKRQKEWEVDYDWLNKADVPNMAKTVRLVGVKSFPPAGKALAFGAADDPAGGFIQPYRRSQTSLNRDPLRTKLYEAPYDIDLWNDTFFVATGRGQTVERLRVDDFKTGEPIVSEGLVFKPGRVKVSGSQGIVWVASYNEIFWGNINDKTLTSHATLTSEKDFVGDIALGTDDVVFASCTNSNEIKVVEPTSCEISSLRVASLPFGCPTIERPVWLGVLGDLLLVAGYDNGVIWVLSVS